MTTVATLVVLKPNQSRFVTCNAIHSANAPLANQTYNGVASVNV